MSDIIYSGFTDDHTKNPQGEGSSEGSSSSKKKKKKEVCTCDVYRIYQAKDEPRTYWQTTYVVWEVMDQVSLSLIWLGLHWARVVLKARGLTCLP